jgi:hypothetical protein
MCKLERKLKTGCTQVSTSNIINSSFPKSENFVLFIMSSSYFLSIYAHNHAIVLSCWQSKGLHSFFLFLERSIYLMEIGKHRLINPKLNRMGNAVYAFVKCLCNG